MVSHMAPETGGEAPERRQLNATVSVATLDAIHNCAAVVRVPATMLLDALGELLAEECGKRDQGGRSAPWFLQLENRAQELDVARRRRLRERGQSED